CQNAVGASMPPSSSCWLAMWNCWPMARPKLLHSPMAPPYTWCVTAPARAAILSEPQGNYANTGRDVRSCDRMENSYFFYQERNNPLGLSVVRTLSHVSKMPLKGPLR